MRELTALCVIVVLCGSFVSAEPLDPADGGFDPQAYATIGFCYRFGELNEVFKFENAFMGVDLYFSRHQKEFSMADIKIPIGTISLDNPYKIGMMVVPEHDPSMFWDDERRKTPREFLPRLYGFVRNVTSERDIVVYIPLRPFFNYQDSRDWPFLIELRKLSLADFRFFGGQGELVVTGNYHSSGKHPGSTQFEGANLNLGPGIVWTSRDQNRKVEISRDYSEFSIKFEL